MGDGGGGGGGRGARWFESVSHFQMNNILHVVAAGTVCPQWTCTVTSS